MLKKIIASVTVILFLFTGCTAQMEEETEVSESSVSQTEIKENEAFMRGAWISYFELTRSDRTQEEYKSHLESMFINMAELGISDVFLHVRAFGDAIYPSEVLSAAQFVCGNGGELPFDVLSFCLEQGKKYGMSIHAWINPYRALNGDDVESLEECRMKKWLTEKSSNVVKIGGRYYFNPASDEVRELIIDGVREILINYPDVKGIHIDDYFYPESCGDFDKEQYTAYASKGGKMSLADFRRENVNSLVASLYTAVKSFGEDKIFSVSPSGNIEKNYSSLYADTALWCSQKGYCDIIIPQIYFGFRNESLPFKETVDRWAKLTENSTVKLVIGLALYKCGETDEYAGDGGKNEWIENSDVIKRQVEYVKQQKLNGFSLYSASFINFSESFLSKEVNNLKSVL